MLEETDKKLDSLLAKKEPEQQISSDFENKIKEKLEDSTALLLYKVEDGSIKIKETEIINKDLLYSIVANAVLIALLITKIVGVW